MLSNDGLYQQIDSYGESTCPPMLANGWLSKYDSKGDVVIFSRYMDDILREIHKNSINETLDKINELNPISLKFTIERETNNSIAFLDMEIHREDNKLQSTWFTKETDTGLVMNFHSLAPMKYKKSVVCGMIHRIFGSCSNYKMFHQSL